MSEKTFSVQLRLLENYLFQIDFGEFGNVLADEPEPIGGGEGPSPTAMLAASVANCLSASLLFALRKYKQDPGDISATVTGTIGRVEKFQRVTNLQVQIRLAVAQNELPDLAKAVSQFENFCTVTESVRHGIPVDVEIVDNAGVSVHRSTANHA
ncbi:MAG: OsmC family protein [Gammaproteobacteria bacterium]|nr:OsmC family protein [Gammaproteobacteria bacterium]